MFARHHFRSGLRVVTTVIFGAFARILRDQRRAERAERSPKS
jgi:hypothetical protein